MITLPLQNHLTFSSSTNTENVTNQLLGRITRPHLDSPSPIQTSEAQTQGINAAELQQDLEILKYSLQKVRLYASFRVFHSKAGIKKDCQSVLSIVSKCARYLETAVKQLSVMLSAHERDEISDLSQYQVLFIILQAEIVHLQGEYRGLIAKASLTMTQLSSSSASKVRVVHLTSAP